MSADQPESGEGGMEPVPDANGPRRFITRLVPIEQQVGEHVIAALQQPDTVAVLTTVLPGGDGAQHIVSVPLSQDRLEQVRDMLEENTDQDLSRVPCIGFHCFLPPRVARPDDAASS